MQTHRDRDVEDMLSGPQTELLRELESKAKAMIDRGESQITAGRPCESVLVEWVSQGVMVRQLPPDEHGVLRISVGGGKVLPQANYLVFRGDKQQCIDLLTVALSALQSDPRGDSA